mmetsp:Transcript_13693/g.40190  ORF Transcript_13693/g.40190 Transcript_13693/m.40190 type:complete len:153 (+) Transcript_13693:500-958(+)
MSNPALCFGAHILNTHPPPLESTRTPAVPQRATAPRSAHRTTPQPHKTSWTLVPLRRRSLGCRLCGTLALPDHAPVPATALAQLRREAATEGALLVTTEKDAARLDEAELRGIEVLPLRLEWTDGAGEAIDAMIGGVVAARGQPLENGRYAG